MKDGILIIALTRDVSLVNASTGNTRTLCYCTTYLKPIVATSGLNTYCGKKTEGHCEVLKKHVDVM